MTALPAWTQQWSLGVSYTSNPDRNGWLLSSADILEIRVPQDLGATVHLFAWRFPRGPGTQLETSQCDYGNGSNY
jgi:hypothetical protein